MPHDQNFKNLILDYPRPALEFFAAEDATDLTQARIVPIRQEQLKERLGERFRELDISLLVEWPDGMREAINAPTSAGINGWPIQNEYLPRSGQMEAIMGLSSEFFR